MRISETATRAKLIDPLLTTAGWNLKDRTQVDFEIPVDGYDKEPWNGVTDYCLFHPSGEVLAIVEAKKTSRHSREGQEQLRIYLDKVAAREGQSFVPFGFMSNGQDVFSGIREAKIRDSSRDFSPGQIWSAYSSFGNMEPRSNRPPSIRRLSIVPINMKRFGAWPRPSPTRSVAHFLSWRPALVRHGQSWR